MNKYTIFCTQEQTKKALELGAQIKTYKPVVIESKDGGSFITPTMETVTAEQMIGFIIESGRGYSTDLSELIREQGYKQGCLTFIDSCLK